MQVGVPDASDIRHESGIMRHESSVPVGIVDMSVSGFTANAMMAGCGETDLGAGESLRSMGSKGKRHSSRQKYDFSAARSEAFEPPGGLPSAGSGFEPDPFSPVGSWIQSSRFIDALGRRLGRRVMILILVVMAALYLLTAFH